jgi:hypothetical protein
MSPIARAAASVIGMTAVFALVLYLAYGGSGGDSQGSPTPSPLVAASATARPDITPPVTTTPAPDFPLPAALDGTSVMELVQGPPIELPESVALIIETGCWQCDGPSTGLKRVYRNPAGQIISEVLLDPAALGYVDADGYSQGLVGFDATDDGSWIVAGVCSAGYCGHLGTPSADARTVILESRDGGVTWTQMAELQGAYRVEGVLHPVGEPSDVILSGPFPTGDEAGIFQTKFSYLSTGEALTAPAASTQSTWPVVAPDDDLLWQSGSGVLLDADGDVVINLEPRGSIGRPLVADLNRTRWGIPWVMDVGNGPSPHYLTLTDRTWQVIRTLASEGYVSYGPGARGDEIYGNAEVDPALLGDLLPEPGFTFLPVQVKVNDGVFYPILDPFTGKEFLFGRNRVVAVKTGPFAQVTGVEGSCLNIRIAPSLDADVLDCVADGVLLQRNGIAPANSSAGGDWLEVSAPDGSSGYAAAEYLEWN